MYRIPSDPCHIFNDDCLTGHILMESTGSCCDAFNFIDYWFSFYDLSKYTVSVSLGCFRLEVKEVVIRYINKELGSS